MINIKNVSKSYHYDGSKLEVLKDISLDMEQGEFVAIYGESGTGKSTLMNLIAALDSPDSGQIIIDGEDIVKLNKKNKSKVRNQKIGFVFQSFNLISHLKAVENVELPAKISGDNIFKARKKAKELLTSFGLENHMKKSISKLSGGQKQRVAIARALINDPEIVLADEPTGALDSETGKIILNTLKEISNSGKLVIVITHEKYVLPYATKVVYLKDGGCTVDKVTEVNRKKSQVVKKKAKPNFLNMGLVALNNIIKRPFKNGLYALTSSLAISMALLIAALNTGIVKGLEAQMEDLKGDANKIAVFVPEGQLYEYHSEVANYALEFEKIDGVKSVYPIDVSMNGAVYNDEGLFTNVEYDVYASGHHKEVEYGRIPTKDNEIVITQQLAATVYGGIIKTEERDVIMNSLLNKTVDAAFLAPYYNQRKVNVEIKEKGYVDYLPIEEVVIVGIMPKNAVGHKINDIQDIVYITNELLSQIHGRQFDVPKDMLNYFWPIEGEFERLRFNSLLRLSDTEFFEIIAEDQEFSTLTSIVYSVKNQDKVFLTENEYIKYAEIFGVLNNITTILFGFILLSVISVLFMFGAIQYVSVASRIKEIGILNALGISKSSLLSIFNVEAIIIAVASSLIAIQTSIVLTTQLRGELYDYFMEIGFSFNETLAYTRHTIVSNQNMLYAIIGAIIIAIVASIIPSIRVSNIKPIDALREE